MVNEIVSYDVDFKESMEMYMGNKQFQTILNFYLFEALGKEMSFKGKDFDYYGIKGRDLSILKEQMLGCATPSLRDNYLECSKMNEISIKLKQVETVLPPNELSVLFIGSDASVRRIFSYIRNAFAHGRFCIKQYSNKRIYILENIYHGSVNARMIFHEKTLLNWIDCVHNFNELKQSKKSK